MVLLDTDVVVDILRGNQPALQWLSRLDEEIALPGFVAMELVQGCANMIEQRRVERFISRAQLFWLSNAGCSKALQSFTKSHLDQSLGLLDALIGEIAIEHDIPLNTFNVKHYKSLPNLRTLQPYKRR